MFRYHHNNKCLECLNIPYENYNIKIKLIDTPYGSYCEKCIKKLIIEENRIKRIVRWEYEEKEEIKRMNERIETIAKEILKSRSDTTSSTNSVYEEAKRKYNNEKFGIW